MGTNESTFKRPIEYFSDSSDSASSTKEPANTPTNSGKDKPDTTSRKGSISVISESGSETPAGQDAKPSSESERSGEGSPKPAPSTRCPSGTLPKHCNETIKCLLCQIHGKRRRLGDPEWLKARRRLSNRRDSPVLLRLLEDIRRAQH